MIKLTQLTFSYPEMEMYFDLYIPPMQSVAITGKSGAGKSSLLNLIAGFESAKSGTLQLAGHNHFASLPNIRPISILFQSNNLFSHLTVEQNIGLGIRSNLKFTSSERQQISMIAEQMKLNLSLTRKAEQLSGGQKQRVALARTLLRNKPILLLDEPFSGLDFELRLELQNLVQQLCKQKQLTLLMVTHQLNECQHLFDRVIEIEEGKINKDFLVKT